MNPSPDQQKLLEILEKDPFWCAYALADLEPPHVDFTHWYLQDDSLLMTYHGFQPPTIFAAGETGHLASLGAQLPPDSYQITLKREHLDELVDRLSLRKVVSMLRMVHSHPPNPAYPANGVVKLGVEDAPAIKALFSAQPDQPDAFHPRQMEIAPFYGIYADQDLIAVAGTHIFSQRFGIAAVGNVFTHPEHRNQGLAGETTGAVVSALTRMGAETILLNVRSDNEPAVRCYTRLGFTPYCQYYEGWGTINS